MSDEQTPGNRATLLAPSDATPAVVAPLLPAAPQFSSRRELREAAEAASRRPRKAAAARSLKAARDARAPRAPKAARPPKALRRTAAPQKPGTPRAKHKHPIVALFVILAVPGLFASVTMPAYAFTPIAPGGVLPAATRVDTAKAQDLRVSSSAVVAPVKRDVITATTESEYQQQQINAAAFAVYNVGPRQAGDDYPWPNASNTLSPLNYFYRQCVDFVAWRLNRDAGVTSAPWKWTWQNLTPSGGNASQWKYAWEQHGWKTSAQPVVGSVAWFVGNHVAYVKAIAGSNVVIEEYNAVVSLGYDQRTIPISQVGRFLYPPP